MPDQSGMTDRSGAIGWDTYFREKYVSPLLARQQPDQSRRPDDDPVPGEGREAVAGDDADERLDHHQRDDEGDDEADRDVAEVAGAELGPRSCSIA